MPLTQLIPIHCFKFSLWGSLFLKKHLLQCVLPFLSPCGLMLLVVLELQSVTYPFVFSGIPGRAGAPHGSGRQRSQAGSVDQCVSGCFGETARPCWLNVIKYNKCTKHTDYTQLVSNFAFYVIWVLSFDSIGSWHGSNWDFACV